MSMTVSIMICYLPLPRACTHCNVHRSSCASAFLFVFVQNGWGMGWGEVGRGGRCRVGGRAGGALGAADRKYNKFLKPAIVYRFDQYVLATARMAADKCWEIGVMKEVCKNYFRSSGPLNTTGSKAEGIMIAADEA